MEWNIKKNIQTNPLIGIRLSKNTTNCSGKKTYVYYGNKKKTRIQSLLNFSTSFTPHLFGDWVSEIDCLHEKSPHTDTHTGGISCNAIWIDYLYWYRMEIGQRYWDSIDWVSDRWARVDRRGQIHFIVTKMVFGHGNGQSLVPSFYLRRTCVNELMHKLNVSITLAMSMGCGNAHPNVAN